MIIGEVMESTVIQSMVDSIINNQQSDAVEKFNEIIASKVSDALEARKQEVATSIGIEKEHEEV
jgi:hypothetical protein